MTVDELRMSIDRAFTWWGLLSGFRVKWVLEIVIRSDRIDPRACLEAVKMYGSWEGLLSLIECQEGQFPGDCPLCGAT